MEVYDSEQRISDLLLIAMIFLMKSLREDYFLWKFMNLFIEHDDFHSLSTNILQRCMESK